MSIDKLIERDRYDQRAKLLNGIKFEDGINSSGVDYVHPLYKEPYIQYENMLTTNISCSSTVIELGAGTGAFTRSLLNCAGKVFAIDISSHSLNILNKRHHQFHNLETLVADMESLPFLDNSVDVIVSSGSLSYGDNFIVMSEIYRVLKKGGKFICVDSLHHNPVYIINRIYNYLCGNRTLSTLLRMPTISMLESYRLKFGKQELNFYGSISWAIPLLSKIIGVDKASELSKKIDITIGVKKSAFKFTMLVEKI